jgi:predicted ArsR family transcriptional regulator
MTRDDLARLAPLADPVRRALYEFVVDQPQPVDRDAAAVGVGVARPLAAFHLDRLVAAGLLEPEFHRRSGRSGPGAGRPAKFYRRSASSALDVSLPPRRYSDLADVLAEAVEGSADAEARAVEIARARGRTIAERLAADANANAGAEPRDRAALIAALNAEGYEPTVDDDGIVRLRNCPFDRLAADHRSLTCSLNLATLTEVGAAFADAGVEPVPRPRDGYCCVAFVPAS